MTSAIISAIEAGAETYRMPWIVRWDRGLQPMSVGSAKPYRGVNTIVLWSQAQAKGFRSAFWGTYRQWQELGGQVRRGEHGSPVVYWGTWQKPAEDPEEESSPHLFARGYTVFNLDQVDGCRLPRRLEEPKLNHGERIVQSSSPPCRYRSGMEETARTIGRALIPSICRISTSSRSPEIIIPSWRTRSLTGPQPVPVATASWGSASAIRPTPWKS